MTMITNAPHSHHSERLFWLDALRAFACLMVVMLHVSAAPVMHSEVMGTNWKIAVLVDSFTRVCVPLFFMITGFLFLGNERPHGRHLIRVICALIFYSVIALLCIAITQGASVAVDRILSLGSKPAFYHLWFLYPIICIYLFAMLVRFRHETPIAAISILAIFFIPLNPTLSDLWGGPQVTSSFRVGTGLLTYLLYAIAGATLGSIAKSKWLPHPILLLGIFVGSSLAIFCLTVKASAIAGGYDSTFFRYESVLVSISSFAFFLWVTTIKDGTRAVSKPIRSIADKSLAIYGLHAFVLIAVEIMSFRYWAPAYIELPVVFTIVTGISYALASALRYLDPHRYFT